MQSIVQNISQADYKKDLPVCGVLLCRMLPTTGDIHGYTKLSMYIDIVVSKMSIIKTS